MRRSLHNAITDVPGINVGHASDLEALTGCTVVLCEDGAVGGVDQRGGAPGTRETDALHPTHLVQRAHAVVLGLQQQRSVGGRHRRPACADRGVLPIADQILSCPKAISGEN